MQKHVANLQLPEKKGTPTISHAADVPAVADVADFLKTVRALA